VDFSVFDVWIKAILMITVGFIALRLVGRKSLSKMTISQAVIMIAVGSILVEPVKRDAVSITITSIFLFVLVLLLLEFLVLKIPIFERFLVGKPLEVILDGKMIRENMQKLRLTKDQLDMLLRENGVSDINDVKIATLETNGNLTVTEKEKEKALTLTEFKKIVGTFYDDYRESNDQLSKYFNGEIGDPYE
jgi:uncharacterized membrane protein YcaP (DUF421 family)